MKVLIPIIVGAIIGYCTNWLAIKMLFRPYYEKRIMGLKIPFTPGLIPKEKNRIGKSIGETVGVYLLSPETIIESLWNDNVDKGIKSWLESKINKIKESKQSIKDILSFLPDESYMGLIKTTEENISNIIISQIRGEYFNSAICNFVQNKIDNINPNNIYEIIDEKLGVFLLNLTNSTELKDGLINLIEAKFHEIETYDKEIVELIPKEIIIYIDEYMNENGESIANIIKENFKKPNVQNKLKQSISDLVSQNLNKLIIAFISPDVISEKIFHIVEKYINSEEANKDISILLRSILDNLLESKASAVMPKIRASLGDEGISKIAGVFINYTLNTDNQNRLLALIGQKLKSSESQNKEWIKDYLIRNVKLILDSKEMEDTISLFIQDVVKQLMDKPMSAMTAAIDHEIVLKGYDLIKIIFDRFAKNQLPHIIEMFNISKIVEDKVNSFDVEFTEELILDIASKELKAITWLGALLGGIMGVLSPLLQMLY